MDGDGKADLAVANWSSNTVSVFRNAIVSSPVPTITSFTPTSGLVGSSVTITGTNFSTTAANNTVKFGTVTATVTSATATSIVTTVPTGATTGTISVTVGGLTGTSSASFTVTTPPTITSFTPSSGPVGTSVTITGTNFSTTAANNTVQFNGVTATITGTPTATSIVATVPTGATTGTISVTVGGLTGTSSASFTVTSPPTITSFTPSSGPVGTSVTITGTNFSTTAANNTVKFNGTTATITGTPTATSIVATVPTGATTGTISVTVGGLTGTSSASFTVTSQSGPVIAVSGDLNFGEVVVGETSYKDIIVTNTGTEDLILSGLNVPSGVGSSFTGLTIPSNQSATVNISFSPSEAVAYSGDVSFDSNATTGNNSLNFTGTGILSGPRISLTGNLDFGNVIIDSNSAMNLTISNTGNESMSITGISFPMGFSSTFTSGNVAANDQQIISVVFAPTAEQTYSGNVTITSNSIAGTGSIAVQGVGIQPLGVSEEMSFTVYPVPFVDKLIIQSNEILSIQQLEVFDMEGKRVYHIGNEIQLPKQLEIDLSELSSGIYILTIKIDDIKKVESYRILKN